MYSRFCVRHSRDIKCVDGFVDQVKKNPVCDSYKVEEVSTVHNQLFKFSYNRCDNKSQSRRLGKVTATFVCKIVRFRQRWMVTILLNGHYQKCFCSLLGCRINHRNVRLIVHERWQLPKKWQCIISTLLGRRPYRRITGETTSKKKTDHQSHRGTMFECLWNLWKFVVKLGQDPGYWISNEQRTSSRNLCRF